MPAGLKFIVAVSICVGRQLLRFPLPFVPAQSYKGSNGFGGSREKVRAGLRHAANDLRAEPGTPVLAMADGLVLANPYLFFRGTYALEIQHLGFIARYCEIDRQTEVVQGDRVLEGQVIAYVGNQPGNDMLHIEFFKGTTQGPLSFTPGSHPPYDRRSDVFDGAKLLDDTRRTVNYWAPSSQWHYEIDADGRKYVGRMDLRDI
jgi:murein DD-endopeptidase MepM/ murein hydrolase activator NlpD